MSDRPATGAGADTMRQLPDDPPVQTPAGPTGRPPDPDTVLPNVPNALLERPLSDQLSGSREDFRPVVPHCSEDAARHALARLCDPLNSFLPAFHLPVASSRHPAVVAAAACPDLFLLDAPVGPVRILVTADIAEQAAANKQRVLILTPDAEFANAVLERLARRNDVLRILAPVESLDQLPPGILARTEATLASRDAAERRTRLEKRIAQHSAAVASIDQLDCDAQGFRTEAAIAAVESCEAYRSAVETRDAGLAELTRAEETASHTRSTLEAELQQLKAQLAKPTGLFKRLLGGAKADPELTTKVAELEAKLAELAAQDFSTARTKLETALQQTREQLLSSELERRRTEFHAKTLAHRERLKELGFEDRFDLREQLAAELADATAELATVNDLPPMLSSDARSKLLITIAVLTSELPDGPFDRVVFAAADPLSEAEFLSASIAGRSWVLIGQSGPVVPPARSNRHGRSSPFFVSVWNAAHCGLWTPDFSAPTARLVPVPLSCQHTTTTEPLADQPDVELRMFESPSGDPVLSEVRFPARTSLTEIRQFLAEELGDLRLMTVGPARWQVTADQLTCCWPAGETPTGRSEWITLPNGIKEKVSDPGPAGLTVAISFDPSRWTRTTAEEWITAHTRPTPRTAVLPR